MTYLLLSILAALIVIPALSLSEGILQNQSPTEKGQQRFTTADLSKLRWIEGTWRGTGDVDHPFFERYRFESPTVLVVESFENEKLEKINEVTRFELKDGSFGNGGDDSRWRASEINSELISFEPVVKARNSFTWKKVSKDLWQAILSWPATDTKPARQRIYQMERWPKAQ